METPRGGGVVKRALAMVLRPGRTWQAVAQEDADDRALFLRYAMPLAAIPAVCRIAAALIYHGFSIANVGVRVSLVGLILESLVGYVLFLAAAYGLGRFIDLIAPAFGGVRGGGVRLVVYAATAMWIGGLAELWPSLSFAVAILAGLYSLSVLYTGLAPMMGLNDERRLTAFAAILFMVLLLAIARGTIAGRAAELGGPLSASYAPR